MMFPASHAASLAAAFTAVSPTASPTASQSASPTAGAPQRVVVVNGNPQVLDLLDRQLDEGHYDMVFVESTDRAYTQIRKVLPGLVVLCSSEHDLDTCQLLTMLKLDMDTCDIPILTWAPEPGGEDAEVDRFAAIDDDVPLLRRPAAALMN